MTASVVLAVVLGVALLGAIAALVLELRKTRVPRRPAGPGVTGREALEVVDLGLRTLTAGCARAGRELPDVYTMVCSEESLTLRLARPDADPPRPWDAHEEAEEWAVARELLAGGGTEAWAEPSDRHSFPLTVTLGLQDGERVLVDLARTSAPIAVMGAADDIRRLVRAFVAELVTGPVGREAEVTLVGSVASTALTDGLGLRSSRLHTAATLEEALARGADPTTMEPAPALAGVTQVYQLIEGSDSADGVRRAPRLFVMDAGQFRDEAASGGAACRAGHDRADALLVLGDVTDAAWRLRAGADGTLDTGPLGLKIDTDAGRLG